MASSIRTWISILVLFSSMPSSIFAQNKWIINGSLETNINLFLEDSLIGASGIPQYDNNDLGGESWLEVNATYNGWRGGIRLDAFQKSNLLNPNGAYTDQGIGKFFLKKKVGKIEGALGYLYDQIGSGIIFRSYEERPLLIDNALVGGSLAYDITEDITVKGYYGKQKNLFDIYDNVIRGGKVEGFFSFGEESPVTIAPGLGYINRVLSDNTMDGVVNVLRTYIEEDRVLPKFNVYLGSFYNTTTYKGLTWYIETAVKSAELFYDPNAIRTEITGTKVFGKYVKSSGSVVYSSVSFAANKLGITVEAKRTSNFNFRINPLLRQNEGLVSFIPPMNRQQTYRLLSRYNPATQDLNEWALQFDIQYSLSRNLKWQLNVADIKTLEQEKLYTEIFMGIQWRKPRKWVLNTGIQVIDYNQEVYEVKPEVGVLRAVTPYVDFLYKFSPKNALRTEIQYMNTQQDYGDWLLGLMEFSFAPHWQVELSGMYNIGPAIESPTDPDTNEKLKIFYPTLGFTFTSGQKRINIRYVKQVEGVVCTGGICRLERAFSGIRLNSYVGF